MDPDLQTALAAVWEQLKPVVAARIRTIRQAVEAGRDGSLHSDLRREAESAAHKLAGSLGMYGYERASHRAGQIEAELQGCDPLTPDDVSRLTALVRTLEEAVQ